MSKRRLFFFIWASTLCATIPALAQTSLDAPLVDKPPTLRSEMVRGKDAALTCSLKYTIQQEPLQHCLDSLRDANRQRSGTNFEAFDTGFYFIAWSDFNELARISETDPGPIDHKMAKIVEALYWNDYVRARTIIAVQDDAVIEALMLKGPIKAATAAAATEYGDAPDSNAAPVVNSAAATTPSLSSLLHQGTPVHFGAHFVNASSFMAGGTKPPDKKGASILTVDPNSVAEKSGIKPNDVIRKYDGTPVQQANDMISLVSKTNPGQLVSITIWRDGTESTVQAQF